ncbi:unnamed protein product [Sphagnum tenellum]
MLLPTFAIEPIEASNLPKKSLKNREDYNKNKEKILQQARIRYQEKKSRKLKDENIIPLFPEEVLSPTRRESQRGKEWRFHIPKIFSKHNFTLFFFQVLVIGMTYFLMTETAQFYATKDPGGINPWLKAGLLEGAVIAFTIMGAKGLRKSGFGKVMSFLIYVYTLWVVSGNALTQTDMAHEQRQAHSKEIVALEEEIQKLTQLRDRSFESHRNTLAMKIQQDLLQVRHRKEQLEGTVFSTPNSMLLWNSLLTLVVLRLIVMITNLFCLQELARRYRLRRRGV